MAETLRHELKLTWVKALIGLMFTILASVLLAAGASQLAFRDKVTRTEEWARGVDRILQQQAAQQQRIEEYYQNIDRRLARLEGALGVKDVER